MYAINIADLTAIKQQPEHAALLLVLQQHIDLDPQHAVECERRKAAGMGYGAPLTCLDEQAEALIHLIRTRLKRYQLRIYHRAGGWKRV